MAIDVTCECGREFGVTNDSVGRSVKCPECGSWVRVSDEFSSVEAEHNSNAIPRSNNGSEALSTRKTKDRTSTSSRKPAKSKQASSESRQSKKARTAPRRHASALRNSSVPLGITWMYYGLLIGVIATIGFCTMTIVFQAGRPGQGAPLVVLFGLAIVVAAGLMIIGKLFCLSAPSQIPGNGGILLSLAFDGFAVLISIAQRGQSLGLSVMANLLTVASFICFLAFLKGLGEFLKQQDIADRAASVLWLLFVNVALWLMQLVLTSFVVARAVPHDIGSIGSGMLGVVLVGLGIFSLIRFAGLLSMCRLALAKQ